MRLPEKLTQAIESALENSKKKHLNVASQDLTKQYREEKKHFKNDQQRLAYLAVRMPATFAAVSSVLNEVRTRAPQMQFDSLIDIGSGPGTVFWATQEHYPLIKDVTLIEKDPDLVEIGKQLAQHSAFTSPKWLVKDIQNLSEDFSADLITLSYVLNELSLENSLTLIEKLWKGTKKTLVVIEPGTPRGFSYIRAIRQRLIELGAHLVAPCPHYKQCPMVQNDWCHFSVRLERSASHRQIKDVSLSYEDEKYSYVVASRESVQLPHARVLRHPQKRSGHVNLVLCQEDGTEAKKTFSRKQGELYQIAKKLEWGDVL
jgi:ribosomal protein RSM22 (predicted rRNA methylase)